MTFGKKYQINKRRACVYSEHKNTYSSLKIALLFPKVGRLSRRVAIKYSYNYDRIYWQSTVHTAVRGLVKNNWLCPVDTVKMSKDKGQIISKCLFGVFNFFQKTNENTSHTSKNEFIRSFFGRIHGLKFAFEINWPLASSKKSYHWNRPKSW